MVAEQRLVAFLTPVSAVTSGPGLRPVIIRFGC